jgi:hypothetical protein
MQMQECVPRCPGCPGSGPPAATTGEAISCTTIPWPPRLFVWHDRGDHHDTSASTMDCYGSTKSSAGMFFDPRTMESVIGTIRPGPSVTKRDFL